MAIITDGVRGRTRHDLTNKVDDGVAACSEPADDLEFLGGVHVYDGSSKDRGANRLAQKE